MLPNRTKLTATVEPILSLFLALVVGCSPPRKVITPSPIIITMSATSVSMITSTRIATSTTVLTATVEPVQTPLPTLDPENASLVVRDLLENNSDCQLPCWWGVIPGQTNWRDVEKSLSPITTSIYENTNETSDSIHVEMFFPAPYPLDGEFRQVYLVKNNIVERIEILPQHFSKYSLPKGLLQEFGNPEKVFLGGSGAQPQSFQLILYYPSQGIFALYSNKVHPVQQQEILDVCFTPTEIDYVDIFLWEPADSFSETLDYIFGQYDRPFYAIERVTELTGSEFYELFVLSDQTGCLQTPSNVWPN